MLEQLGNAVKFLAFFTANKQGVTGLTVTVDVYNPAGTLVTNGGSATAIGGGLYAYVLASENVASEGEYVAIFKTADSSVDQQHIPALWVVGRAGVESLDAATSTRLPTSSYVIPPTAVAIQQQMDSDSGDLDAIIADLTTLVNRLTGQRATNLDNLTSAPLTSAQTAAAVLDAVAASYNDAGSIGEAINDAGAAGLSPADVWGHTPRTLTQAAAAVIATVTGDDVTVKRGDTITVTLTGLGSLAGRSKLWFTVKPKLVDPEDSGAVLQVIEGTGLTYLNGAAATAGNGSLVVDDEGEGDITLTIEAAAAGSLVPGAYRYDVQVKDGSDLLTVAEGAFVVTADVTRATS